MAEPFIGEIIMFGGNFAPRGWALCDGQLLPISSNTALFSILGTTYGGDGRTTFALPDLRGRVAVHCGNGPGLTPKRLGDKGGTETNTLNVGQLPSHNHSLVASSADGDVFKATGNALAKKAFDVVAGQASQKIEIYTSSGNMTEVMKSGSISNTGNNMAINNIQPFQCVNYIIALQGVFPSRS